MTPWWRDRKCHRDVMYEGNGTVELRGVKIQVFTSSVIHPAGHDSYQIIIQTFPQTLQATEAIRDVPELPQGSTLFTLLEVSPQGSVGGAMDGGGPSPHGSELVGDVGDATPHGSAAAAPHAPEAARAGTVGGGEGPAEPTVATAAAAPAAPQGSTAPSSIRAP